MDRFCSNCKTKLGSYDHYFCSTCGQPLEEKLIKRDAVFKRVADFAVSSGLKPKLHINFKSVKLNFITPKVMIGSLILLLFVLSGLYLYKSGLYFNTKGKAEVNSKPQNKPDNYFSAKTISGDNLDWALGKLGESKLLPSVPFEAILVIEGYDLPKLGDLYKIFDPAYESIIEYFADKTQKQYVLFASKSSTAEIVWSILLVPADKNINLPQEFLASYPWLKIWKNDPVMLVTTNSDVIAQVGEAKAGKAKNFTHTPVYSSYKTSLGQSAKVGIYINSTLAIEALESLMVSDKLPDAVKLVLQALVKSKSDFSIVL